MDDVSTDDELTFVFARLGSLLLSEETLQTALGLITLLAHQTVYAATGAGVTLIDAKSRTSAAATGEDVRWADARQYELDEGPCLDAWRAQEVVVMHDIATESRWPQWTAAVSEMSLRSCVSSPLSARGQVLGAIKVYSDVSGAFDEHAEHLVSLFAAQAAILVANKQALDGALAMTESLRDALRSRDVIGQAKGVVMAQQHVDEEEAFAILVQASQRSNVKVREISRRIVASLVPRGT
jgi:GAF domain-containing protein